MTLRLGPAVNLGEPLGGPERNYSELYTRAFAYQDAQAGVNARVEVPALAAGMARLQTVRVVPPTDTFYVNAANGNDANDGYSWETAKQNLNGLMYTIAETFDMRGRQVVINLAAGSYTTGVTDYLQPSCNSSTWNIRGVGPDTVIANHIGVLGSRIAFQNLGLHSVETWNSNISADDVTFVGQIPNGMPHAVIINCTSLGRLTNTTISGSYQGIFALCKFSNQLQIEGRLAFVGQPNIDCLILVEYGGYTAIMENTAFSGSFVGKRAVVDWGSRLDCRPGNPDTVIPGTNAVELGQGSIETGQVARVSIPPTTSERWTGEVNRGKRVYCRVIDAGAGPNAGAKSVAHGIANLEEIISFQVRWLKANGEVIMTAANGVETRMDKTDLVATATGNMSAYNLQATCYYLCSDR